MIDRVENFKELKKENTANYLSLEECHAICIAFAEGLIL